MAPDMTDSPPPLCPLSGQVDIVTVGTVEEQPRSASAAGRDKHESGGGCGHLDFGGRHLY